MGSSAADPAFRGGAGGGTLAAVQIPRFRAGASVSAAASLAAALLCLAAPGPAQAQKYDWNGQPILRRPMKMAHDSLVVITVHRLAPGVYAAKNRFVWNGWIEMPDGILVIDGGYDARSAEALADTIRARSGRKPIRYLVVTSNQFDHTGGVRTFAGLGATVVAHASAEASLRDSLPPAGEVRAGTLKRAGPKGAARKVFIPVTDRLVLGPKTRPVVIEWAGRPACTGGDLFVYLPKQRLMFSGDLAWNGSVPWLVDPDFSRTGWLATIDTLLTARFPVDSLVPGHGRIGTKVDGLMFTRRYLAGAWELASKEAGWGVPVSTVDQWGDLAAYQDLEFYDTIHYVNMRRLYLESKGVRTPGRGRPGVYTPKSP